MRQLGYVLVVVCSALLTACAGGEPPPQELVARNFMRIAFGSEFGDRPNERLSKWTAPEIGVFLESGAVAGAPLDRVRQRMTSHFQRLERLTGLRFAFPGPRRAAEAHVIVFLLPKEKLHGELRQTFGIDPHHITCFGTAYRKDGVIRGALIGIPEELPAEEVDSCLVEELTQTLGLFMDDAEVRPSIFNDDEEFSDLTWQDELFLRILYDPRLKPGMRPKETLPLVRKILHELRGSVPG